MAVPGLLVIWSNGYHHDCIMTVKYFLHIVDYGGSSLLFPPCVIIDLVKIADAAAAAGANSWWQDWFYRVYFEVF